MGNFIVSLDPGQDLDDLSALQGGTWIPRPSVEARRKQFDRSQLSIGVITSGFLMVHHEDMSLVDMHMHPNVSLHRKNRPFLRTHSKRHRG